MRRWARERRRPAHARQAERQGVVERGGVRRGEWPVLAAGDLVVSRVVTREGAQIREAAGDAVRAQQARVFLKDLAAGCRAEGALRHHQQLGARAGVRSEESQRRRVPDL